MAIICFFLFGFYGMVVSAEVEMQLKEGRAVNWTDAFLFKKHRRSVPIIGSFLILIVLTCIAASSEPEDGGDDLWLVADLFFRLFCFFGALASCAYVMSLRNQQRIGLDVSKRKVILAYALGIACLLAFIARQLSR